MRRGEKEIKDKKEITTIMEKALVCRIALVERNCPYIVPVNFVMRGDHLYFHCAPEGRKIEIIKNNNQACFEVDDAVNVVPGDSACSWGTKYLSVIGFGRAFIIEDMEAKKEALDWLMEKYAGRNDFTYKEDALKKMIVVDIKIENITGKKSGYK
jgi:nitroimidazol reductase NimA-like FMN-containing flavoprotein (pyridoxamine 5'-phosphate oxidase superfamily)